VTAHEAADTLVVRAPAKLNLHLRVQSKRPDGFHDVETVLQSVAMHDVVTLVSRPGPLAIRCGTPGVPLDETNLAWRAAERVAGVIGRRGADGIEIRLDKRIPARAGLGGGSADAAATLLGLAGVWGLREIPGGLESVAASLGVDVPFLLTGGTSLGTGRGDRLTALPDLPAREVVVVVPALGISTAEAYGWLERARQDGGSPVAGVRSWPVVPEAWRDCFEGLSNDLEAVAAARYPVIGQIRRVLAEEGAELAAMTGSGSAVFGLFAESGEAVAAADRCVKAGWTIQRTRTLDRAGVADLLTPRRLPLSELIG